MRRLFSKKAWNHFKLCINLFLARIYGRYECNGWNGEYNYVQYEWKGKLWEIPLNGKETF